LATRIKGEGRHTEGERGGKGDAEFEGRGRGKKEALVRRGGVGERPLSEGLHGLHVRERPDVGDLHDSRVALPPCAAVRGRGLAVRGWGL
jgi:hypothetical protein